MKITVNDVVIECEDGLDVVVEGEKVTIKKPISLPQFSLSPQYIAPTYPYYVNPGFTTQTQEPVQLPTTTWCVGQNVSNYGAAN